MEILVPQRWSVRQIKLADVKRGEFKPSRYTSGSANLDNMIALDKAVILCPDHSRKFSPVKARYCAHPDKKLRRVRGNCDVCRAYGLSYLFICERDGQIERLKLENFRRALEYGCLVQG